MLVGRATANPMSHPIENCVKNLELQPTCTDIIVKVITVSKANTIKKAVNRPENLALSFTAEHQPKHGIMQPKIKF